MLNRIIRILGSAACCALLLAGCSIRLDDPAPNAGQIGFSAGSALLRNDATKSASLITGTSFPENSQLHVWAWHSAAAQNISFGGTTKVHLSEGAWDYSPHQFWNWRDGEDYYDFLSIYPGEKTVTPPSASVQQSNLQALVPYNALSDQFDLMAAGLRRTEKITTTVPLQFSHLLSAVGVKIKNASSSVDNNGDPLPITLKSCSFVNLITSSSINVVFDGSSLSSAPGPGARNAGLGPQVPAAGVSLNPGSFFPSGSAEWDIMIPQDLRFESLDTTAPSLRIVYNKGDVGDEVELIPLKEIKNAVSKEEITSWEAGVQYQYEIEIKLGGGILVIVRTTPWEVIEAETPGLMII